MFINQVLFHDENVGSVFILTSLHAGNFVHYIFKE